MFLKFSSSKKTSTLDIYPLKGDEILVKILLSIALLLIDLPFVEVNSKDTLKAIIILNID